MKKFLVNYMAPMEAMAKMGSATPEEKEAGMKVWMDWQAEMGEKIIDFGAPLMPAKDLDPNGKISDVSSMVTGYSLMQHESQEGLMEDLKSHAHLQWTEGCSIEGRECVPFD